MNLCVRPESDLWEGFGVGIATLTVIATVLLSQFLYRSTRGAQRATEKLTDLEAGRDWASMCPQFRITVTALNPGGPHLRMWIMLAGPFSLDQLDRLTITIRNDNFSRGNQPSIGIHRVSPEEIKAHIWGPYRFTPRTGHDNALSDHYGRELIYSDTLPIGEELILQLEPSPKGGWMDGTTTEGWQRQAGTVIRLGLRAEREGHKPWYLPVEIDVRDLPVTAYIDSTQPFPGLRQQPFSTT